ncbi:sensor domain-containing diguanylate cyclase [Nocardioides mesophilus]|uniref:Diguanylate cyclase n=1 Tax=Nocardioides mesophilus TaxID=433659 RepID=A0A7G9R7A9_9ACTN|nr:sensor domain-containing diguanylate cyclase [Nocardioides mesophilus]QNN51484.1 diguanylate cyclase [Nocardioides mesophilus]
MLVRELEQQVQELERRNAELRRELAERAREAEASRVAEAELRLMVDAMPQIVWIARPDGWHVYFNQNWMDFTGLTLEESLGDGWNPPFHPEDRGAAAVAWEQATRTGERYEIEYRLRRFDGSYHWMLGRAIPLRSDSGEIVKWFGTCTDIEELKQAQARIGDQARLLDLTQDAILVQDLEHRVVLWNQGAERILGWSAEEVRGRSLVQLIAPDGDQLASVMDRLLERGEWSGELTVVDKAGAEVVMEGRWNLLRHDDGTPRAALAVNTDVTERRRVEAALLHALEARATHDTLTGLANRALLFDQLELLLGQRHRTGVAVAFIDLDAFKSVNDRWGHRAGDQVLVHVAERLRETIRQGDVAARIGGDEFVVVGAADDPETALRLGERLADAVAGTTVVEGREVAVSASVGVAFVGRDEVVGADDLISRADSVMYDVKRHAAGGAGIEDAPAAGGARPA